MIKIMGTIHWKRFPLSILICILIFLLAASTLYVTDVFSYSQYISINLSLIITTINFLAGITAVKISLNKKEKTFIKIVFGSMIIRLLLMLAIILIMLVFLDINRNSFIFSIFFFYIFYLLVEVFYLNLLKK